MYSTLENILQNVTVLYSSEEVLMWSTLYNIIQNITVLYSSEEVLMWCDDPDLLAWEVRTGWGKLLGGIKQKYVNR